ncbi:hypothetical protein T265_07279 [Opisthorchis viverrini]|uniref:Uncharacterized protein n=1 Tax=Opisthorchis viverrini TaxID=6198 RepID=A0A074ZHN6_OPIVI|nr:hypothetical protein T265_07279 [Opisthorchis viverrini]KER25242.1 hypothetical protein T265_07279 [Opisthorchis viverrini]
MARYAFQDGVHVGLPALDWRGSRKWLLIYPSGQDISVNANISDNDDEYRKHTVLPIITRKLFARCERHFHQKETEYRTVRNTTPINTKCLEGYRGGTQDCIACTDVHSRATCLEAVSTKQRRSMKQRPTVSPMKSHPSWHQNKQVEFIHTLGRQASRSAVVSSSHSSVQRHEITVTVTSRIIMHGPWSSSNLCYSKLLKYGYWANRFIAEFE